MFGIFTVFITVKEKNRVNNNNDYNNDKTSTTISVDNGNENKKITKYQKKQRRGHIRGKSIIFYYYTSFECSV